MTPRIESLKEKKLIGKRRTMAEFYAQTQRDDK
jgi:hypothetical protein